jgi:FkbH-like protein
MKLEIISNINMDSLKFYMKDYSFLSSSSFGNYMIDLVDSNSLLSKSESDIIIFFLDLDVLNENIDELIKALDKFTSETNKTIIINTMCYTPYYIDTYLHKSLEIELNINIKLLNYSRKNSNILLLDFSKLIKQNNFFDEKYWYLARIKFSKTGFELIAKEVRGIINTYKNGSKKVLVLDMDNTLWGGVVGEEEIVLSNEGIGKIYLDFQVKIKKLKELGIILAVCSKNNFEDGVKGLNHSSSILNEDDFIIKKINWNDKASNIKEIIGELNLGDDSIVFIDDNPVEREYVKSILPNVIVPEFPTNIYTLNRWFLSVINDNFSKIILTKEDLKKQIQYTAKKNRNIFSKNISYEKFIKSLDIKIDFYINDYQNIERYSQMTQKTNQFNLTTKRYTVLEMKNFIDSDNHTVIAVSYKDKFANEGITGLVILNHKTELIEIDTFLLSCRILKRGVEKTIFNKLDLLYPDKVMAGKFIPSSKNMMVRDLFLDYNFFRIDDYNFIKNGR